MAISEAARSDLYTGLRDVLGRERAETLMSAIPLHDLEEVATKGDLAVLRGDVAGVRAELKTDIADLRAELKTDIGDLRAEIHREFGSMRKTFTTWMLTLSVAIIAAMASIVLTS